MTLPSPHPTPHAADPAEAPAAGSGVAAGQRLLSLVVPVFNEEATIDAFLARIGPPLEEALLYLAPSGDHEIVFVDDGSSDRTAERILAAAEHDPRVKIVRLSRNFGKDAALAAGLRHARGDAVIPIDVDLQDPPETIARMVAAWLAGAEVVNAVRSSRNSDGWLKRFTAAAFYRVYNVVARDRIPDNVGDFRLLDRKVVEVLNDFTERNRFMKGVVSWVGFEQATVRYERAPRAAGTTKWKYWALWNFALDGITASTTAPLRIWTYVGLGVALCAIVYALVIVFRTLIFGVDVPGYASLMTLILVLGALNLISVGILGEYIGRIAIEVRQRPLYAVRDTHGFDEERQQAGGDDAA
ncbi:MAG: glycosyltransferase family 2 protein [Kiloniellaceae bacterium]